MDKKFGELSIDEKLELHRAMYEGKKLQYWSVDQLTWETKLSIQFAYSLVYRIAPEPETDIELPWHVISPEYQWAARDGNGNLYVYPSKPSTYGEDQWWYGYASRNCNHIIHKPGNKPWNKSLIKRPEGV